MKKRIMRSMIAVCVLFLLAGCQPTPEEPVVVNKNDGKLEEKMQATPAPTQVYEAPTHWSETVEGEKLNIVIDTDVILPDVSAYPVVKLEQQPFTQEQVDDMVHYFAGDAKLYLPHVETKADYDEEIVYAKRGQEIDGEFVVNDESKAWVEELEKRRDAAPDDSPVIYCDTTLAYRSNYETGEKIIEDGKNFLSVVFQNEDGSEAHVSLSSYAKGESSRSYFSYALREGIGYIAESWYRTEMEFEMTEEEAGWDGVGALFEKVTMHEEDALAMAEKVIGDLGIKDMVLVSAEKAVAQEMPDKGGYILEYARQSGGIPLYWFTGGSYAKDEEPPQYYPPFAEEHIEFQVNEDGIQSFFWSGCAQVAETVSDNVQLLPFEDVQQALKDQIFYKKSFMPTDEYYGLSNFEVDVTSAQLRMGYIGVKDNENQAMMVPVWVFETTFGNDNAVLNKHQSHSDDTYVLNAIDGGVIEMKRHDFKEVSAG